MNKICKKCSSHFEFIPWKIGYSDDGDVCERCRQNKNEPLTATATIDTFMARERDVYNRMAAAYASAVNSSLSPPYVFMSPDTYAELQGVPTSEDSALVRRMKERIEIIDALLAIVSKEKVKSLDEDLYARVHHA